MKEVKDLTAPELGRLLEGFGVNLLVRRVAASAEFLRAVLQFEVLRQSEDYAVLAHRGKWYQLHADPTYASHPLFALLPQAGMRGVGVELRLFEVDPDAAEKRARAGGYEVLQATADKPHGLRECFLLDPDGYCWAPSVRLPDKI